MNKLCIDCAHRWMNTDGINMCGRPIDEATTPGPRYCYSERFGPPRSDRAICGPAGQYFEAKP